MTNEIFFAKVRAEKQSSKQMVQSGSSRFDIIVILSLLMMIFITTSCSKEVSTEVKKEQPTNTLSIKVNGVTYSGYLLTMLQTNEHDGNYRITVLFRGNPSEVVGNEYKVWVSVKASNIVFQGVNNTANKPAVFVEKDESGKETGKFIIQIPAGYYIGKFVN